MHHWECHSRYLTTCAFHRHKGDLLLASGGNDKTVKIWKVKLAGESDEPSEEEASSSNLEESSSASTNKNAGANSHVATPTELDLAVVGKKKTTKITDWTVDQVCDWLTEMLDLQVSFHSFNFYHFRGFILMITIN